jgi:sugar (pentulose or hexulose) kinase
MCFVYAAPAPRADSYIQRLPQRRHHCRCSPLRCKLQALWIKQNRPQLFSQAAYVCEYQDYLNFHLTGRMCASLNNVSVRWHYAAHKADPADRWPRTLLHKLGMPELLSKWPQEVPPGAFARQVFGAGSIQRVTD